MASFGQYGGLASDKNTKNENADVDVDVDDVDPFLISQENFLDQFYFFMVYFLSTTRQYV
ncbi:hypothetical protein PABG_03745 [Paracoccidioides brasiliensis Pb03]|uniref:Uncharacterized protein n=2 Tax=Paracoccidioides brasiliensis TaxID=121759 RepID=A0A0A0HW17_PARBD|nr:uncharacterized protein PADG_11047 [Paracoccidioides brasiliensis Pb18]EEH21529.2 hypothetical protein PABG_03745 [Paracoccidioides brasiliensis Pb03]KGM92598.1 hypothetical protein PADG_11047 [Paracoccidioides brasiliensis Pb18]ODH45158.1 hypothetical protein ACO22_00364 [Paracoccidioides brasiliensis]